MTNEQLQQWVEKLSLTCFGRAFRHQARFNPRLTSTGGRYFMGSHDIEISSRQLEAYGPEEVEKIIKHELCHYHLHLLNKGYRHRDPEFKELLRQVGGSRHCRALPGKERRGPAPYRYKLVCTRCSATYIRRRRMDAAKYACGTCRGPLQLHTLDFNSQS